MTPAQLDTAKRMKSEGKTLRAIAMAVGIPRPTVGRALKGAA